MDDTRERLCMMFVQTQHKLVNMNVDRVYETEPTYRGQGRPENKLFRFAHPA